MRKATQEEIKKAFGLPVDFNLGEPDEDTIQALYDVWGVRR